MIPAAVEALAAYGAMAPSGDNAQPWRFVYRPGSGTLAIEIDEDRVDSPKSLWRFVARLSCGAALENLCLAAPCLGFAAAPIEPHPGEVCRVRLQPGPAPDAPRAALELLRRRTTNRNLYDACALSEPAASRLARAVPAEAGVGAVWIFDRARVAALARPIYEIDAAMYGIRPIWRSIERRIRFDRPWREEVGVGLSRGSLALPAPKLWAIRRLGRLPHGLLREAGLIRAFARRTLALVRSAGGLCVVVCRDDGPASDVAAGRAIERAWLALTAEGLGAHPMNSIALMEHVLEHGEPDLRRSVEATPIRRRIADFRRLVPEARGGRIAFVMRFGHGPAPNTRNGRLPLEAVLRLAYDEPAPATTAAAPRPAEPWLSPAPAIRCA